MKCGPDHSIVARNRLSALCRRRHRARIVAAGNDTPPHCLVVAERPARDGCKCREHAQTGPLPSNAASVTGQKPGRTACLAERVAPSVAKLLDTERPEWRETGWICRQDLREYRRRALENMLRGERGKLTELDRAVVESLSDNEILARNIEESYQEHLTFGDRLADHMADFAGSWTFIIALPRHHDRLDDRQRRWRSSSGRSIPIPSFSSIWCFRASRRCRRR